MRHQILFIFLLLSVNNYAQPLAQLLEQVAENNLSLKILEKNYYATLEKAPQVNQRPDPEIGIGVFPLPVETRLGGQTLRLSAMQMFPWPGTLDSKEAVVLAEAKVQHQRISAAELELHYQIGQAYFKLYEIKESRLIIERNLVLLETLERLALVKVESGSAIAADVLRVQLQIEALKQELEIWKTKVVAPTTTINQILNRPLDQTILIADSLDFAIIAINRDSLMKNIVENHPMLHLFDLQQEVSKEAIALNAAGQKPSFGVGLDYITVDKRSDAMPVRNGRDILQVKGVLRIPLYKGKYEAKEKEEQFKIEAINHKKEDLLSHFKANIEIAFATYEASKLQIALYQKQIALTQATIRILETNYSTNAKSFDELLRLQMDLIDYDLKTLRAIVQSHLAKSDMERYINNL